MATKSNQKKLLPIVNLRGKYYTRIRWGNDKYGRGQVCFPLATDKKSVAEHRRDIISSTSLRGKIIQAYEDAGHRPGEDGGGGEEPGPALEVSEPVPGVRGANAALRETKAERPG